MTTDNIDPTSSTSGDVAALPLGDPVAVPPGDPTASRFTVGQVAGMLQVQPAFLRRLDEHDVVRPDRSQGNQRRYTRSQVDRVEEACRLVDEGLTLAGIRRVFALQARIAELETQLAFWRGMSDMPRPPGGF